jgi:hypothetical protein
MVCARASGSAAGDLSVKTECRFKFSRQPAKVATTVLQFEFQWINDMAWHGSNFPEASFE